MDSFEFNKIAGAVLGAALFILLVSTLSNALFASHPPEEPVYLASLTTGDGAETSGEVTEESIDVLLASADAGKGENVAKKCVACHTFENGGAAKVGPNLWDIVNRTIAAKDEFAYSVDLAALGDDGQTWDYESLDAFIHKPKDFASGTKMAFGGISRASDRADLLAYLRSLSESPAPLPEVTEEADVGTEAADGTQTAAAGPAGETVGETASDAAPADFDAPSEAPSEATSETMETPAEETEDNAASSDSQSDMAAAPANEEPAPEPADSAAMSESESGDDAAPQGDTASEPAAEESPSEMAAAPPTDEPAEASPDPTGTADGVLAMISSADVADGEKVARKCLACHDFSEGGKNKVGPPLWDIVNGPVAAAEGFRYSNAMQDFAEGGKTWTFEELDAYLVSPKDHVPKTKMAFAGLKKEEDRAAILAYLRSLSSDPAPLP